jgi:hypothetical protein
MYKQIFIASTIAWGIFVAVGFIIVFIYISKTGKKYAIITHLDRIITTLWLTAGVVFVLIILFCYRYESYPTPYILAITGMTTFISGMMIRYTPLIGGGILFAVVSVISIFVPALSLITAEQAEFNYLKEQTQATSGNLSVQINKLKEAGYIEVKKKFKGNYPQTICKITKLGIRRFEEYIDALQGYLGRND